MEREILSILILLKILDIGMPIVCNSVKYTAVCCLEKEGMIIVILLSWYFTCSIVPNSVLLVQFLTSSIHCAQFRVVVSSIRFFSSSAFRSKASRLLHSTLSTPAESISENYRTAGFIVITVLDFTECTRLYRVYSTAGIVINS